MYETFPINDQLKAQDPVCKDPALKRIFSRKYLIACRGKTDMPTTKAMAH